MNQVTLHVTDFCLQTETKMGNNWDLIGSELGAWQLSVYYGKHREVNIINDWFCIILI